MSTYEEDPGADGSTISADHPFVPEIRQAIAAHMNDDHAADTLAICRVLGHRPEATAARVVDVDRQGLVIEADLGDHLEQVRVDWLDVPTDRAGIRHEIVRLHDLAHR